MHVDIAPSAEGDQEAEAHRFVFLGTRIVQGGHDPRGTMVMADPDGNELCLLRGAGARRPH